MSANKRNQAGSDGVEDSQCEPSSELEELKRMVIQLQKSRLEDLNRIRTLEDTFRDQGVAGQSQHVLEDNSWTSGLPKEILTKILAYLVNDEASRASTFMNCRLVHSLWKEAIDDCPEIMRKIVFDIPFIGTFLESTVASKVKAIRFSTALKGDKSCLVKFFKAIGENVEDVTFEFNKDVQQSQFSLMFSAMMANLPRLKRFHVSTTCRSYLRKLRLEELMFAGSSLRIVSFNVEDCTEADLTGIKDFILCLPSLSDIEFYNDGFDFGMETGIDLISTITEYMEKHDSLKHVEIEGLGFDSTRVNEWLLLVAVKRDLDITLSGLGNPDLNLYKFVTYASDNGHQIPANDNKYLSIKRGFLRVTETTLAGPLLKVGYFVSLQQLDISVKRTDVAQDLQFLANFVNLQKLKLTGNVLLLRNVQNMCLPSLKNLTITGDFVDPAGIYGSFHRYFPNLERLRLNSVIHVPSGLIYSLAKLQKLDTLELVECEISDYSFTELCEPTWANFDHEDAQEMVPAIAAFKTLWSLSIDNCKRLTDSCIKYGIAFNKTLKKLRLVSSISTQFATGGFELIMKRGGITLELEVTADNDDDGDGFIVYRRGNYES